MSQGIPKHMRVVGTPRFNGLVERKNRTPLNSIDLNKLNSSLAWFSSSITQLWEIWNTHTKFRYIKFLKCLIWKLFSPNYPFGKSLPQNVPPLHRRFVRTRSFSYVQGRFRTRSFRPWTFRTRVFILVVEIMGHRLYFYSRRRPR